MAHPELVEPDADQTDAGQSVFPPRQLPEVAPTDRRSPRTGEHEGRRATGPISARGLCDEAIRLGRLLAELMPDEPEVLGLLALMLLHHARREARIDDAGVLVPLEEQDRIRWDRDVIGEAIGLLDAARRRGEPGPCQVQAAIAGLPCHRRRRGAGRLG